MRSTRATAGRARCAAALEPVMIGGVPGAPPVKSFPHSAGVLFAKVGRSDNGPEADRHGGGASGGECARRHVVAARVGGWL